MPLGTKRMINMVHNIDRSTHRFGYQYGARKAIDALLRSCPTQRARSNQRGGENNSEFS